MRKKLLAGLVVAMGIPVAMAVQVKTGSIWGPYQTGLGGEFTVSSVGGALDVSAYSPLASGFNNNVAGDPTFQTFCLESSTPPENIYLNTTYDVVVNEKAMWGGTGTGGPGDTLSKGTGWLYSQFATGTLGGYNYGGTATQRRQSADLLQRAFWWLEGEGGITYSASNPFMAAVVSEFLTQAGAQADGASTYGVFALNLTKAGTTTMAQDQLYYAGVPDGGITLMFLGLGVSGIAFIARRQRK